jgi:hypothetical protein
MADDDDIIVQISADIEDLKAKLDEVASKVHDSMSHVEESAGGVGEALEDLKGKFQSALEFAGVGVAIEALNKVREVMGEIAEQAVHLEHTATLYQTNTESLQGLYAAATEAGVGTETIDRGLRILEARLQSAREGSVLMQRNFKDVGVTMADLHDPTFQAVDALYAMAQSGASTGDMMAVLGPRGIMVAEAFGQLKRGQEAVNAESTRLGALTEDQISELAEYHRTVATMSLEWSNFKERIGATVVPALETLITEFKGLFSQMADGSNVLDGLKVAFNFLMDGIVEFFGVAKEIVDGLIGSVELIGKVVAGAAAVINQEVRGNFIEAVDVATEAGRDIAAQWNKTTSAMQNDIDVTVVAVKSMDDAFKGVDDTLDEVEVRSKKMLTGDAIKPPLPKHEEDPILKALEIELEEAKKGSEEKIELAEEYAQRSAEVYKGDVDKALAAYKRELDAYKEMEAEKLKEASDALKDQEKVNVDGVTLAIKTLDEEKALHKISDQQYLVAEEALIRDKYQIEIDYYNALAALPNQDLEKQKQYAAEVVSLQTKEAQDILAAQTKAAQQTQAEWQSVMRPIESAWESAIEKFVDGTETFQKAFKNAMDNMVKSIFESSIKTMVNNWVTGQNQMTAASQVWAHITQALHQTTATTTKQVDSQAAVTGIQADAAKAGSGAASAMASIPYVGPALAIAAMAAIEAAVLALIGKVASAEGGMLVDEDQLAMVHEDEMILPSHISQGINERILGNGGFGSGGDTYNLGGIHATDAQSFSSMLKQPQHSAAMMKQIKTMVSRNAGARSVR